MVLVDLHGVAADGRLPPLFFAERARSRRALYFGSDVSRVVAGSPPLIASALRGGVVGGSLTVVMVAVGGAGSCSGSLTTTGA